MNSKVLISVIVPVYNVVDYLERCVNSILCQTYSCLELILVDDGSNDGSGDLCDILAAKDKRIICIHKKNGGLSSARNAALDICKGEYITYVDSDDMISPNAMEIMLDYSIKYKSDAVVGSLITFSGSAATPDIAIVKSHKICEGINVLQEILCKSTRWEACGHLFKCDLWKHIRFPQGKLYEDFATIPYVFAKTKKVVILDTAVYYYYYRSGSIMRQSESKVSLDLCSISQELVTFFKSNVEDNSVRANICSGVLMELCSRTDLAAQNLANNKEFVDYARKILKRQANHVLQADYYSIKQKIYYLLESFGFHQLIHYLHRQPARAK